MFFVKHKNETKALPSDLFVHSNHSVVGDSYYEYHINFSKNFDIMNSNFRIYCLNTKFYPQGI